jgi:hypothetical protein
MKGQQITQNVYIYPRRRWGFPLLAFVGFVIAFFWPLALPGWWKLAEIPWLSLVALIWGIANGMARSARKTAEPSQPAGPRDWTPPGTTLL